MSGTLRVSWRSVDGTTVVEPVGELDIYSAAHLRQALSELIGQGHVHFAIDLNRVDFLDSTGLGVIVGALKKVRVHDGSVALICANDRVLRMLRITGMSKVFAVYPSEDSACRRAAGIPAPRRPS
jgi:anti-sigma B factor antagonist